MSQQQLMYMYMHVYTCVLVGGGWLSLLLCVGCTICSGIRTGVGSCDGMPCESAEGGGACVTCEAGDTGFIRASGDSDSLAACGVV